MPVDGDRLAFLMGCFEQVEDVHHRLDTAGVEVQQMQFQA